MNILVIGNGFDLAHGLPTTYGDFLVFIKAIQKLNETYAKDLRKRDNIYMYHENMRSDLRDMIVNNFVNENDIYIDELLQLSEKNIWFNIFQNNSSYVKENWIDFENEISKVIQSLNNDMFNREDCIIDNQMTNELITNACVDFGYTQDKITNNKLISILERDIKNLIRCLEIYLFDYVEKLKVDFTLCDIGELKIDSLLCFNYTNTYERLYNHSNVSIDYIHGKANPRTSSETSNLVLGIDEYLPLDLNSKDLKFVFFKKYYQRLLKETNKEYGKWIETINSEYLKEEFSIRAGVESELIKHASSEYIEKEIKKRLLSNEKVNNLYIYGHSLDITDSDILRELILSNNTISTIFYHNNEAKSRLLKNMVALIGKDESINRFNAPYKSIYFINQKNKKQEIK